MAHLCRQGLASLGQSTEITVLNMRISENEKYELCISTLSYKAVVKNEHFLDFDTLTFNMC